MTQYLELSVSDLKNSQEPLAPSHVSSKRIQYQGYRALSQANKKPKFTVLPQGETFVVPKDSVFEMLDNNDDVLTFFTQSRAAIMGPAVFRITKEKGSEISFIRFLMNDIINDLKRIPNDFLYFSLSLLCFLNITFIVFWSCAYILAFYSIFFIYVLLIFFIFLFNALVFYRRVGPSTKKVPPKNLSAFHTPPARPDSEANKNADAVIAQE